MIQKRVKMIIHIFTMMLYVLLSFCETFYWAFRAMGKDFRGETSVYEDGRMIHSFKTIFASVYGVFVGFIGICFPSLAFHISNINI